MFMPGLALIVVLLTLVAPAAWAKSYDHPLVEQAFRLLPNGTAEVEEIRTFRFEGDFTWATITRNTRGQYGRHSLDYQRVWDADTRQPLRFQVERSGDNVTVRWDYQARDTTKRFLLRYRIGGAVQRSSDVAQFYWQGGESGTPPTRAGR